WYVGQLEETARGSGEARDASRRSAAAAAKAKTILRDDGPRRLGTRECCRATTEPGLPVADGSNARVPRRNAQAFRQTIDRNQNRKDGMPKVQKSDTEWRAELSPEQYHV